MDITNFFKPNLTNENFYDEVATVQQQINTYPVSLATTQVLNNYDENGYIFDGVKVEIEDVDNTSLSNITTQSLKRCKKQVLKHYYYLLCFIGWRPFYKEYFFNMPIYCYIINLIYPFIIFLALIYAYIFEIIISYNKYSKSFQIVHIDNNSASNLSILYSMSKIKNTVISERNVDNMILAYILPSVMHLSAYIMGFIYFRIRENEQLYALMEKVFLSVNQYMKQVSQDRVIKRLKIFILIGLIWIFSTVCIHLYRIIDSLEISKTNCYLILCQSISLIIIYAVYLAVIINYGTQCEMIIFYVQEISTRLDEKSISIKDAMQQIVDTRLSIGNLNSTISKMTSMVVLIFMEKIINVLSLLITKNNYEFHIWFYLITNLLSWLSISFFSILQVARLNTECDRFNQIAISARVYGYHASTRDELDSFLLFVSNAKLKGLLCGIPFKSSYLVSFIVILVFMSITLMHISI